jgi:hypothetical protein
MLTRTIKVSCLSRFLQRAFCYQDKSVMRAAPGSAHCSQSNSCIMTNYWLRGNSYRDTALCQFTNHLQPRQTIVNLDKLCHDTRIPQLVPTWTAKTRAIPSRHRDCFAAEKPGSARCSRRVTQPPFIAVPLALTSSISAIIKTIMIYPLYYNVKKCKNISVNYLTCQ